MEKIADRTAKLRQSLKMTQGQFAIRLGVTRGYLSQIEASLKVPGKNFISKLEMVERSVFANKVAETPARPYTQGAFSNVDSTPIPLRNIPIYSFVQAGAATAYEQLPGSWDDTIEHDGTDKQAFALRVAGDSMEPKFPPGTIITVSPAFPPRAGNLVVATIKGEGALFKLFHYTGDHKTITLTSYNPSYPPIVRPREDFHWIYRVVRATQKL